MAEVISVGADIDTMSSSQAEVIELMLSTSESPSDDMPMSFSMDSKDLVTIPVSNSASSMDSASSPLNVTRLELVDGEILLENTDVIQSSLEGSGIHLDSTSGYLQSLTGTEESDSCNGTSKFTDGQAIRLEDGTMAFLHMTPREGFQAVQLEDGTIAYLSQTSDELFDGEASGLDLEQLSSPPLPVLDEKATKPSVTSSKRSGSTSEKAFHCPYKGCDRVYTTQHHLKVHERSHTGDRPFKCVVADCGKAFATGYGLKSHIRVHTGETPYRCTEPTCTKGFKTSGDLQKHLRTHTGERPFKCPIEGCTRAFTTSNIRKVHIRTHTGERPYTCDACGRAFASATNFKNHIRIHTGEKPYVCTMPGCNKKFTEYSSLYKHHVVHTRDKPYSCKQCGKHYRQTSTLAVHERTAHKNVDKAANTDITSADIKIEGVSNLLKKPICLEFEQEPNAIEPNVIIKDVEASLNEVPNKKLPTIITLQGETSQLLQENSSVYALQLQQDGSLESAQQILLVTDPTQLAALQQLAQVHLQQFIPAENASDKPK